MSKDEQEREEERWFMSSLPAGRGRLLNEEEKQMVTSVNDSREKEMREKA